MSILKKVLLSGLFVTLLSLVPMMGTGSTLSANPVSVSVAGYGGYCGGGYCDGYRPYYRPYYNYYPSYRYYYPSYSYGYYPYSYGYYPYSYSYYPYYSSYSFGFGLF